MLSESATKGHSAQSSNGHARRKTGSEQLRQPATNGHSKNGSHTKGRRGSYDFAEDGVDDGPTFINGNGRSSSEKSKKRLVRHDAREELRPKFTEDTYKRALTLAGLKFELPEHFNAIAADRRSLREYLAPLAALANQTHPDGKGRRVAVPVWLVEMLTYDLLPGGWGGNHRLPGNGLPIIIAAQTIYWQKVRDQGRPTHVLHPWRTTFEQLSTQVGASLDRKGHKTLVRSLDWLAEREVLTYLTGKHVKKGPLVRAGTGTQAALLEHTDPRRLVEIILHPNMSTSRPPFASKLTNLVKVAAISYLGANRAILLTRLMYEQATTGRPVKARYKDLSRTTGLSEWVVREAAKALAQQGMVKPETYSKSESVKSLKWTVQSPVYEALKEPTRRKRRQRDEDEDQDQE